MNRPTFDQNSDGEIVDLLRGAAEWSLIGRLLGPPRPDWFMQIRALAGEVDDLGLREAVELAQREAGMGLYHTTFGPGGSAPPREVSYRDTVHPGRYLGELSSLYEAFAYTPATDEPPDHVSVEAGFVGYLRLKEAYARFRGHDQEVAVTVDAARCFIEDHVAVLAEPLTECLKNSGIQYLAIAGAALLARAGPKPRRAHETAPEIELSDPFTWEGIES